MNDPASLISAYLDGTLTAEQASDLDTWLRADPANIHRLGLEAYLHSCYRQALTISDIESVILRAAKSFGSDEFQPAIMADLIQEAIERRRQTQGDSQIELENRSAPHNPGIGNTYQQSLWGATRLVLGAIGTPRAVVFGAIAALLAIAATLFIVFGSGNDDTSAPVASQAPANNTQNDTQSNTPDTSALSVVATLTAEHGAVWDRRPESNLYADERFALTQGFAEITTNRGAVVILEAPAAIELIDNDNALRLHTGKLVGICEAPSSKGLLVRTPRMDITDIGTEFGVEVKAGQTTATVITGKIEIATPNAASKRLTANQTATMTETGDTFVVEIKDQLAEGFARSLPVRSLVTYATLNLSDFQCQIISRGVREDAKLYTDRRHEINGMDATGLPAVLRGGDLICMPADASTFLSPGRSGIKLELTVSQPAEVYLLVPPQAETRDWLERDYIKTDLRVGFDIGDRPTNSKQQLGVGPGQSIDSEFVVWKRKTTLTGTDLVAEGMKKSMYGVIVVPAEGSH